LTYAKDKKKVAVGAVPELFSKKHSGAKSIMPLSPQEVGALLRNLSGHKLTLAMLMFWGGLRKEEATHLKWSDIDLNNQIMLIKGKGGAVQPVPLLGELLPHLEGLTKGDGYICVNEHINKRTGKKYGTGQPYGCIMKELRSAAKRAGITKSIDHHLLRHTCGTVLMVSGAQQRSVQGILRHASIETTSIYTHLAAQFLKSEGAKMSQMIGEISEINNCLKSPIQADLRG
jgi:site-specific recombinase XerD